MGVRQVESHQFRVDEMNEWLYLTKYCTKPNGGTINYAGEVHHALNLVNYFCEHYEGRDFLQRLAPLMYNVRIFPGIIPKELAYTICKTLKCGLEEMFNDQHLI